MKTKEYITASEIGDYVYCKRSWWLRSQGLSEITSEMQSGTIKHTKLQSFLSLFKKLVIITAFSMTLAIITLIISFYLY